MFSKSRKKQFYSCILNVRKIAIKLIPLFLLLLAISSCENTTESTNIKETIDITDTVNTTDEISSTDTNNTTETPGKPDTNNPTETPDKPDTNNTTETPGKPDTNNITDTPNVDLVERPFSEDSPWNKKIPNNAIYSASSDQRTQKFRNSGKIEINSDLWTIWVWQSKKEDPIVSIQVSARNLDSNQDDPNPRQGVVQIRLPSKAHPDPATYSGTDVWGDTDERDAHMVVIDQEGKFAHEFWQVRKDKNNGTIKAVSYASVPLDGLGINISGPLTEELTGSYYNPAFLSYGWGATRAYGGSSVGGLIRDREITKGPIKHAIAMALPPSALKKGPILPATSEDFGADYSGNISMGTRFAIPRVVDLQTLGLSLAYLKLAQALQDYGAIVIDRADNIVFYTEGSQAQAEGQALKANKAQLDILQNLLTVVKYD